MKTTAIIKYKGKKYKSFSELARKLGLCPQSVSDYYNRHNGYLDGLGETKKLNQTFSLLNHTNRNNPRQVRALLKPCTCGSNHLVLDNLNGWSCKSIRCIDCGRTITTRRIDEALKIWNIQYKMKNSEE